MEILFLHGWQSIPGGLNPTYLKDHGHTVWNPKLPDDGFDAAVRIAQAEFDQGKPDVVVGSSRGGAGAMNIDAGVTPLVLLCPAWKRWGTTTTVKPNTTILHSRADETVPFADSEELVRNSGLPSDSLIEVGTEHRLADLESLAVMRGACERASGHTGQQRIGVLRFLATEASACEEAGAFVAVSPSHQRQGIGQALVNEGLKTIRNMGAQGCVLVGDPAFYRRFGFQHDPALSMEGVPPEVLLCLPMCGQMPEGSVTHHPALSVGL